MTYDPSAPHDADRSSVTRPDVPSQPEDPSRRGERPPTKPRRGPEGAIEEWSARALVTVAGLDPDGASRRNDQGFSSTDSELGRSLAHAISTYGPRMTEKQWPLVVRLATRYRGQGEEPMPAAPVLAPTPPPSTDSPDVLRVRAEIQRAEGLLDDLLRRPLESGGARCVNTGDLGGAGWGTCGACALGPRGPRRAEANRLCRGISYLAERRAWLFEAAGEAERAREIREDMGLVEVAP